MTSFIGVSKFGSVRFLPEKNSQTEKKRDPKRTGTGPNRPVPVRFRSGFLSKKPDKPIGLFWAYFGLFNRLFNGLCNGLLMDFY
jgi:hypothetical protein